MFKRDKRSVYEQLDLRFKVLIPISGTQKELFDGYKKNTEPVKTGFCSKAFYMSHEGDKDTVGKIKTWGTKSPFSNWRVNTSKMVDGKVVTKTMKLDGNVNTEGAVAEGASIISDSVTDLGKKLAHAQKYNFRAASAIEFEFGNKKIGLHKGNTEEAVPEKPDHDKMIVEGSVTMPASFNFYFREIRDYIAVQRGLETNSFIVTVDGEGQEKDDVIIVQKMSGGGWNATGMNGFEYKNSFGGFLRNPSADQVKDRVAFDLAVANYHKGGFLDRISNCPVQDRHVKGITTRYESFGKKEFDVLEQG